MKVLKRLQTILIALILLAGIVSPLATLTASAASTNLIANSSFETANGNAPASWSQGSWGTNTNSFSYLNTGNTGTHSAQVTVSSYTSGDAKWYFAPVAITSSTSYDYTDMYQSTVASDVVAQFDDGAGNYTYQDLGTAATSATWKQYTATFVTPQTAKNVTIFHLIAGVGSLTIDDVTLGASSVVVTPPTGGNLIANNSFETVNGTAPLGWSQGGWGTNTRAFNFLNTGNTGTHSAQVTVSSYTSGDAKWYFAPVAITSSTKYTYSDYYQSNVATNIVAQFDDGAGNYTYTNLGSAVSSTAWKQFTVNFTSPQTAKNVTIFHVIAGAGSLTIDDTSLTTTSVVVTPPSTNLVPNSSVETVDPSSSTTPLGWFKGSWGTNTSTFKYTAPAHTGAKSVSVTVKNYVSGSANWTYAPQAVTAGKVYEFSNYYQSTVSTQILLAVNMSDGSTQYLWLGNAFASPNQWTKFFTTVTMPAGAVSAVAYQDIASNGTFTADDFVFQPYVPTGFDQAYATVTFDDGIATQYTNALPVLQSNSISATFYIITGDIGVCDPAVSSLCYMTSSQVIGLYQAGQEIGSHTVSHPDLTTLTATQLTQELQQSQATLQGLIGSPVVNLAAPYGRVNSTVLTETQKYYTSHRGTDAGYNSIDNFNRMDLLVQDVNSDTTVAQVEAYIDYAKATNTWLVLVYHDINPDMSVDPGYNTTPADFATEMAYLKASGVKTGTLNQVLQLVAPQVQ